MSKLADQFNKLGKALTGNADRLAELVSYAGEEVYFEKVPSSFSELAHLDIILGNIAEGFSASTLLMQLSHSIGRSDTNRRFAPGVEDWIARIQLKIDQYNNAIAEGTEESRLRRLHDISELVFQMREGLLNEVRSMEMALNTRFGHVESIKDKYIENKYLIDYLTALTGKLTLLDYGRLSSLAGSNPELRRLLAKRLHQTVNDCRENILLALPRLRHLLWEIEKQNNQAKRMWALHNFFKTGAATLNYEPSDEELVLLGVACPSEHSEGSLNPNIYDQQNESTLSEIVHNMKPRKREFISPEEAVEASIFEGSAVNDEEVVPEDFIKFHLRKLLKETKGSKVSVLDYWERELSNQKHPSGFMMLAHLNLKKLNKIKLTETYDTQSNIYGSSRLIDFTVERADA